MNGVVADCIAWLGSRDSSIFDILVLSQPASLPCADCNRAVQNGQSSPPKARGEARRDATVVAAVSPLAEVPVPVLFA